MPTSDPRTLDPRTLDPRTLALALLACVAPAALAQHQGHTPTTADRPTHAESAQQKDADSPTPPASPALPEGMTLDQTLDRAAQPPPTDYPDPIQDDELYAFTLFEQLEYRLSDDGADQLGWDAQGWIGYDYRRFVWKSEGEASFDGADEGESENDFLYSQLVTPFWYAQAGAQYANEWDGGEYDDRVSGVVALQGLAPGMFEIDASLYLSQDADITLALEVEYDLRLTQRLVLQPRAEVGLSAQEVDNRSLGQGLTDTNLDLRLRYEIKREFAPYVGVRYRFLSGETRDLARSRGDDPEQTYLIFGVRMAF
jgi:copper resistance protein B